MSESVGERSAIYDDRGTIQSDAACRKCSYNLRGLQVDGRCPECGTPNAVSIHGDLLQYSHPSWLREVADGLGLILWGILASIVVNLGAGFVFGDEPVIAGVFGLLASIVGVVGTWKMTAPDPSGIGEVPGLTARKIVRIAVVCGLLATAVQIASQAGSLPAIALGVLTFVFAVVGIAGEFAKLHYIGLLAARLPDSALEGRARFLKWALAVTYVAAAAIAMILAIGLALSSGPRGAVGGVMAIGCMALPLGIGLIVFSVMSIMLTYRMKKAVEAQVPLSLDLWRNAGRPRQVPPPPPAPLDL